jgi:hypothetical protein
MLISFLDSPSRRSLGNVQSACQMGFLLGPLRKFVQGTEPAAMTPSGWDQAFGLFVISRQPGTRKYLRSVQNLHVLNTLFEKSELA